VNGTVAASGIRKSCFTPIFIEVRIHLLRTVITIKVKEEILKTNFNGENKQA
jgi:hypothetical protein